MRVSRIRDARESLVFVLLTPVLVMMSIRLEQVDPRVPGKFAFLVLLVPTLLVALTGKRWQGLGTSLIAGLGCVSAGWCGISASSESPTTFVMPVLLGGALIAVGTLLTIRCDDAEQRIGLLDSAIGRLVAAENFDGLVRTILDGAASLVPGEVCELHLWNPKEHSFVKFRHAVLNAESGKVDVWDPHTPMGAKRGPTGMTGGTGRTLAGLVLSERPLAPTVREWEAQTNAHAKEEWRIPLTSGDECVFGYVRFKTKEPNSGELKQLMHILATFSGLALKNVRLFERLREQARLDGLTGLLNYAAFQEELSEAIEHSADLGTSVALVLMDLDKFKQVNDQYGHHVGNMVLERTSEVWRRVLPPDALLARYGGDEFACILPHSDVATTLEHLASLQRELRNNPVLTGDDEPLPIVPSFGVAEYPRDGETADELFHQADLALYAAKRRGGGVCAGSELGANGETTAPMANPSFPPSWSCSRPQAAPPAFPAAG